MGIAQEAACVDFSAARRLLNRREQSSEYARKLNTEKRRARTRPQDIIAMRWNTPHGPHLLCRDHKRAYGRNVPVQNGPESKIFRQDQRRRLQNETNLPLK